MEVPDSFTFCDGEWTPSRFGWLSPRISFSKDLAMLDRLSPEKRKRDQTTDDGCGCSSDFEFLAMSNATLDLQPAETMSSADELFFDGKLRPLYLPRRKGSLDVLPCPPLDEEEEPPWSMARHLSYENSRCSSMSVEAARDTARRSSISLSSSRCAPPSRFASSLHAAASLSPKAPKHASNRFTDFFKLHKMHVPTDSKEVPPAGILRDHTVSSSCRLPISPRSFWPFSRSNSAGENKTSTPHPVPPRRSNSAGESKTSTSPPVPLKSGAAGAMETSGKKTTFPFPVEPNNRRPFGDMGGKAMETSCSPAIPYGEPQSTVLGASVLSLPLSPYAHPMVETRSLLLPRAEVVDIASCVQGNVKQMDRARDTKRNFDTTAALISGKPKGSVSPGRMQRRAISSPARNFARASPGRRGVWNSPGRGGTGRVVVRNLERRGDGAKPLGRSHDLRNTLKGSERHNSVSMRVTPVLNVPVCMGPSIMGGKASKSRLFSFPRLFSKKEKSPMVSSTVPNNCKNGG